MASSLSWLHKFKLSQLRSLAIATGINSSGTKTLLTAHLLSHLPNGHFNPEGTNTKAANHDSHKNSLNIISIDMGIRNLAYCRILLPQSQSHSPPPKSKSKSKSKPSPSPALPTTTTLGTPTLTEWTRIAISPSPSHLPSKPIPPTKEPFDPPTYSHHAYHLITTLLSPFPPTHILIERQRYRSMGGAAVQEWTLRVNMFEAMIYAVLNAMREMGMWEGVVQGVAPGRVGRFWLDGLGVDEGGEGEGVGEEGKGRGRRVSKGERSKVAKIGVVEGWLGMKDWERGFEMEEEAEEMGRRFLRKRRGGKRGRVGEKVVGREGEGEGEVKIGKLDDLADCLLQGMAWVQWERNRRLVMEKGVKALDELGKG